MAELSRHWLFLVFFRPEAGEHARFERYVCRLGHERISTVWGGHKKTGTTQVQARRVDSSLTIEMVRVGFTAHTWDVKNLNTLPSCVVCVGALTYQMWWNTKYQRLVELRIRKLPRPATMVRLERGKTRQEPSTIGYMRGMWYSHDVSDMH